MRLLFLTPLFPYPPVSGGLVKTWTILAHLSQQGHQVDVLCFRKGSLSPAQEAFALPLDQPRTPVNLVRSYLARLPLSVYRNQSPSMRALVTVRLARHSYDLLFIDHWLMAQYLPADFSGPSLLHQHNAEHLLWRHEAMTTRNPGRRLALTIEYRRVRDYQASILPRFRWVLAVSEPDRQALVALGAPPERAQVLPNVPDPRLLTQPPLPFAGLPPNVLYLGTLSWLPNSRGLADFLRNDYPLLRRAMPPTRFIIAGSDPPPWLRRTARQQPGLELISPAQEPEPLYRRARAFLEPVRGGGGTKVKVLNALARGLPVVTTPDGLQGIAAVPGQHLLLADSPRSQVTALESLLADEALWRKLSDNGRALIQERYQPHIAYRPLDDILAAVA